MVGSLSPASWYGLTEAGTEISPLTTWDSKITSLVSLAGGLAQVTLQALIQDGYYARFQYVVNREYSLVFGDGLAGLDLDYGIPSVQVPVNILGDFTACQTPANEINA